MIPRLFTARRYVLSILAWVGVWVGVATVSVVVGGKLWTWDSPAQLRNVLALRLEWVATAGVVGAALALAGLAFQALLRNPLADPYVLGVSGVPASGLSSPASSSAAFLRRRSDFWARWRPSASSMQSPSAADVWNRTRCC